MRAAITRTCNTTFSDDSWPKASLPTRMGCIGVRRMEDAALPAFVSSLSATQELVRQTNGLPRNAKPYLLTTAPNAYRDRQCPDYNISPSIESPISQRQRDEAACRYPLKALLERSNHIHHARLLATVDPYCGAWLDTITMVSLGLFLPG